MPDGRGGVHELARSMRLHRAGERKALEQIIEQMLADGELRRYGRQFASTGRGRSWVGSLSLHPDGFGFVSVEGQDRDLFLPASETAGLMHGDVVEVRVVHRRGRTAAELVRVVHEASDTLVGRLVIRGGIGMVEPRSKRMPKNILVREKDASGAHDGDWVRVRVTRGSTPLRGRIIGVLGDILEPARLIDLVIAENGLPGDFPADVLREAEGIAPEVVPARYPHHADFTHLEFVTIDGEDARDFDDAICVHPRGEGFEAWVAIADVAEYVRPDTPLDREARERGNSFYFPDRVIPMLPERLSNGVCSLNPEVPRLAMVVRLRFDANGTRRAVQVHEAVIRSRSRLTYRQVGAWLQDADTGAIPDEAVRTMLRHAERLFGMLERLRKKRGALDLDLPEVRAVLHDNMVRSLDVQERLVSHRLIEEMMLAANTAMAEYFEERRVPLLYRVHAPPKPESVQSLNDFLAPFGLALPNKPNRPLKPADVERILEQASGTPVAHVLHRLILRSMQQARYSPDNLGHFGLAYRAYCHFTSPIRRYADLCVHRRLKAMLRNEPPDAVLPASELTVIGEITSVQERKQTQSEWDTQAMLTALYHTKDVGMDFDAVISGMSKRRMFVELQPTLAEGSLSLDTLGSRYILDETGHRLVSRRGGHAYHLGDRLRVRIESTDPVRGLINIALEPESMPADSNAARTPASAAQRS
jgi:ribonuclease R